MGGALLVSCVVFCLLLGVFWGRVLAVVMVGLWIAWGQRGALTCSALSLLGFGCLSMWYVKSGGAYQKKTHLVPKDPPVCRKMYQKRTRKPLGGWHNLRGCTGFFWYLLGVFLVHFWGFVGTFLFFLDSRGGGTF